MAVADGQAVVELPDEDKQLFIREAKVFPDSLHEMQVWCEGRPFRSSRSEE